MIYYDNMQEAWVDTEDKDFKIGITPEGMVVKQPKEFETKELFLEWYGYKDYLEHLEYDIKHYKHKLDYSDASIYAIISELKYQNIDVNNFLQSASKNSGCKINNVWKDYRLSNKYKLARDFKQYADELTIKNIIMDKLNLIECFTSNNKLPVHEGELIKQMFKDGEI